MSEMYPLSFINDSEEEIPSYAVMQVLPDSAGETTTDYKSRILCRQYDEFNAQEVHTNTISHVPVSRGRILCLNSERPVAPGRSGKCSFAYDQPAWARITEDSGNGDISLTGNPFGLMNEEFGPSIGRWDINAGGWGFFFRSAPDTTKNRVLVQQAKPETPFDVYVLDRTNPTSGVATTYLMAIPYRRSNSTKVKCQTAENVYTQINVTASKTGFLDWSGDASVQWQGTRYEGDANPTVFMANSGGIIRADNVYWTPSGDGTTGTFNIAASPHAYSPSASTKCGIVLTATTATVIYDPASGWLVEDFCCPSSS